MKRLHSLSIQRLLSSTGFSILESILASLIGLALLVGMTLFLKSQIVHFHHFAKKQEKRHSLKRASLLIENIIDELDQHRMTLAPRIHHLGKITYPDGSPNKILSSVNPPDKESDAITSVELAFLETLKIVEFHSSTPFIFRACPLLSNSVNAQERYIAISDHGQMLFIVLKNTFQNGCFALEGYTDKSMSFAEKGAIQESKYLVPVLRTYTLFVDSHQQLRHLGHFGSRNNENQPITQHIEQLRFTLHGFANSSLFMLESELKSSEITSLRRFYSRLGRITNENIIRSFNEM